jgi:p21-activated kinase 2
MHLEVDLNSPCGIKGLTADMMKLFNKNGVDKDVIKENPEVMIQIVTGLEKPEVIPENALLSDNDFNQEIKKVSFLPDNPNENYRFAKQLGKGAMCTVYQAFNRKNPD